MAALAQETAELAARVAEECKSLRTLINANSPDLSALNTSATNNLVAAVNEVWTITQSGIEWDNIQSKPSTFTPSAHVHTWSDITSGVPTSFTPSAHKTSHATGGSDELTASDIGAAPTSHTHTASQISDSTATGRSLMTAANATAARTTLELGNAALATTSTGGNGSSDSGKVLAFGSNGDVRFAYFVLVGGSGTGTLSGTNLTGTRSYESPDANGTLALTASATGVPDNLVTSSTKTTPVDADSVLMTDSEVAGTPAKRLTFANLWTWISSKLGGNLTIGGTKTWSGAASFTSTTRPTSSGTGSPLSTSLVTSNDVGLVIKSTTSRTRSTQNAYADDEDLQITLDADSAYHFDVHINMTHASSSNLAARFYYGGTINGTGFQIAATFMNQSGSSSQMRWTTVSAGSVTEAAGSTLNHMRLHGIILTGTSGLFSLQLANLAATGTVTRTAGVMRITKL